MVFRRILVATDGTDASIRGVECAAQMAARYEAEFLLLTVAPVPPQTVRTASVGDRAIENYVERMATEALEPALAVLRRERVGAEVKAAFGSPAEVILAEIDAIGADLVVMGKSHRTEPSEFVTGSVSDRVAHRAKVPVLLVP